MGDCESQKRFGDGEEGGRIIKNGRMLGLGGIGAVGRDNLYNQGMV